MSELKVKDCRAFHGMDPEEAEQARATIANLTAELAAEKVTAADTYKAADKIIGLLHGDIDRLKAQLAAANKRIKELEGQHKGLVLNNAMLRERPDLPADRIPAARAYERRIAEAEAERDAALADKAKLTKVLDMVLMYLDDEHVGWEDNPFGADDVMRSVCGVLPDNPRAVELLAQYTKPPRIRGD